MHTDQLERYLPRLLDDLADEQTPDYYDDLFWQTARTSQRSAWTLRERWFPMLEIARQPVVAPSRRGGPSASCFCSSAPWLPASCSPVPARSCHP